MELSLEVLALLFLVAAIAGWVDSIAGGGGLITVPALLAAGIPPAQTLATNKLQGAFASFSSSLYFIKNGLVSISKMRVAIGFTFIGSACASLLIQFIDNQALKGLIPILLLAISAYFIFAPPMTNQTGKAKISEACFALVFGTGIGFYDGFFGPGAGALYMVAYVTMMRMSIVHATAHTKVLNFTSNIGALCMFIIADLILWKVGIVMAIGSFIGAQVGARMVITKGQKMIRPMVITISSIMALKLAAEHYLQIDLLNF
ncbi:TSUP family transporter [Paraglaciecola sp.]|uniref:TSUP family transporter n=1 Tax=Paraglaciecola sp. TaxID=1920173 RepID=UPI003EF8E9F5